MVERHVERAIESGLALFTVDACRAVQTVDADTAALVTAIHVHAAVFTVDFRIVSALS